MTIALSLAQREELDAQRRKVDFDTYDVTVDELLRRVARGRIEIAPVYQRQFRWDAERQSRLVESVLLGIPVPPLFMATNSQLDAGTNWEVVDGLQRLLSLVNFAGDDAARATAGLSQARLMMHNLEKLDKFEGASFNDLPPDIQDALLDRPIRVVVLNDKSELQVRFDLFERLNTGGVALTAHEIRECVYRGPFIDFLDKMAENADFKRVVVLPAPRWKDGTPQELVLRFFAFLDRYTRFDHSVIDFLNEYMKDNRSKTRDEDRATEFERVFTYLAACFPSGLKTRRGQTPVNLFEAVAVGAALALREKTDIPVQVNPKWLGSDELRALTTGATNSKPRVTGRIEYCRDAFLAKSV